MEEWRDDTPRKGTGHALFTSILGKLVEPINRRRFKAIVDSHDGGAYDKAFKSWDHLMALIYAQFSGAESLRGLVAGWTNMSCWSVFSAEWWKQLG